MRILAYHAITDLHDDPVLAEYAVPPARFADQLDALLAAGWEFVDLDAVLAALSGDRELPPRPLLLSFDDGYTDLLEAACPILAEREIPAVVFAVCGHIGGANDWDHHKGAANLRLLDDEGLRRAAASRVEVGSHTWSHRQLPAVPEQELDREIADAGSRIEAAGLPWPRAFSYPYGEWDARIAKRVMDAGHDVAFTVEWGVVAPDSDRLALPRIEVHASDTPRKLRMKLAAAPWPGPVRDLSLWLGGVRLDPSAS